MKYLTYLFLVIIVSAQSFAGEWVLNGELSKVAVKKIIQSKDSTLIAFTGRYVPDSRQIWCSTDNGRTWPESMRNDIPNSGRNITGGFLSDDNFLYTAHGGDDYHNIGDCIFKSSNLGETWEKIELPESMGYIKLDGYGNNLIVVGGDPGLLYYSKDAGKSWTKANINAEKMIGGIYIVDENTWFVSLYFEKQLIKTTDGGISWELVFESEHRLSDINSYSENILTLRDSDFGINISFDMGLTWKRLDVSNQVNHPKNWMYGICFIDENTGWFGTRKTDIFHTTDGGITWELQVDSKEVNPNNDDTSINGFFYIDENNIIAYGTYANFNWEPNSSVETDIEKFNTKIYPNPAKANSKVYVSLENDKQRSATCKVFNLTGELIEESQEIAMPKGCHTLDFETDGYITGTYFLVIESNGEIIAREKFIVE